MFSWLKVDHESLDTLLISLKSPNVLNASITSCDKLIVLYSAAIPIYSVILFRYSRFRIQDSGTMKRRGAFTKISPSFRIGSPLVPISMRHGK